MGSNTIGEDEVALQPFFSITYSSVAFQIDLFIFISSAETFHEDILKRSSFHIHFVSKESLWSFKSNKPLKQSLYRISDPYMRFYLKLIEPQRNKIDLNGFKNMDISSLPGFGAHIGLQLEQLLLQNRSMLFNSIGINPADITASGPYRQSKSKSKAGCQIDLLIQTRTRNLFICEFKFNNREIGADIISEVRDKVRALIVPRGFAVIPVLFHISGVSSHVATSEYFYRVIDISNFLREE